MKLLFKSCFYRQLLVTDLLIDIGINGIKKKIIPAADSILDLCYSQNILHLVL